MICGGLNFGCGGAGYTAPPGGVIRITTPYRHPTISESFYKILKKEEKPTMKATYNGFTGELVKLERTHYGDCRYSISLCDDDKNVTYSFSCVRLEDVKFSGGVMIFGG